jgi:short-subunit dehydrogenase
MSGLIPTAKCDIYNITKGAVVALTESLGATLIGTNVGISVFCPGPHDTKLGANSQEVQAALLGCKVEKAAPTESNTLPDYDNSVTRSPSEAGERVIRGIKRKDIYIFTHSEFKPGLAERWDAIMKALPDEAPDMRFYKEFAFLATNPLYQYQTQVPALVK